jgi:hypothetical protein
VDNVRDRNGCGLKGGAAKGSPDGSLGGDPEQSAHPASASSHPLAVDNFLRSRRWRVGGGCGPHCHPQGSRQAARQDEEGDGLQIILIQVKGGRAAMPTAEDGHRLRAVARHPRARQVLLAGTTSAARSWADEFSTRKKTDHRRAVQYRPLIYVSAVISGASRLQS